MQRAESKGMHSSRPAQNDIYPTQHSGFQVCERQPRKPHLALDAALRGARAQRGRRREDQVQVQAGQLGVAGARRLVHLRAALSSIVFFAILLVGFASGIDANLKR